MRSIVAWILVAIAAPVALSQGKDDPPKRPALPATADTNDAQAYYDFGLAQLKPQPKIAADAFYWSTRLNPTRGEGFYARRVALLLTDKRRLVRYWNDDRGTLRSPEIRRIDSMYLHALTLNPFLYEKLDQLLYSAIVEEFVNQESIRTGAPMAEIQYAVDAWLVRAGPAMKAWQAYGDGRFDEALREWASAIKSARFKYGYRSMRGRLFFQLNEVDSSLTELKLAIEEMRKRDNKDLVYVYQSKALLEQSIGMVHIRRGEHNEAKEAFGRALQEDLAYSPAHVQLAFMALDRKDTTTAISEFDLAVQLRPDDAGLRYQYGYILVEAGKPVDAIAQLEKGIQLNPHFSAPHYALGRAYEKQGKQDEAKKAYSTFAAMAAKNDPRRSEVSQKLQ